ncbi:6,7-dimethyl-8-ribityllumazine synthase [Candidatus Micrarchaeota archaeon]|nr:6,7-dimethyl-8-ribityllumazine synthase [Candidatus Micrarchaeota archaeon]
MKIAIIVSKFNEELTSEMESTSESILKSKKMKYTIIRVPGAYEIPLAASRALGGNYAGAIALGAIVKGSTAHDEVIAHSIAKSLLDVSLKFNKPIAFGVLGPKINWQQAKERAKEYAKRSTETLLDGLSQTI